MMSASKQARLAQQSWEHFAKAHKIYEAAVVRRGARPWEECDGEPNFKPRPDCLQLQSYATNVEWLIEIIDVLLATGYKPDDPWHRYAWAALRYLRHRQNTSERTLTARRKNRFTFDYLQNDDGSCRIPPDANGVSLEAAARAVFPDLEKTA